MRPRPKLWPLASVVMVVTTWRGFCHVHNGLRALMKPVVGLDSQLFKRSRIDGNSILDLRFRFSQQRAIDHDGIGDVGIGQFTRHLGAAIKSETC